MNSNTKSIIADEVVQLLVSHNFGQEVEVKSVELINDGWFNAVYMIQLSKEVCGTKDIVLKTGVQEHKYILRYEKDIMKTEVYIYSLLEKTIVPVPRILAKDFSRSLVDFNYFFMERLMGESWMNVQDKITELNHDKLIGQLAQYTAALHQIKGDYFGYIKDDVAYHYDDWKSAFRGMFQMMIEDGRKDKVDLPYDLILTTLEPLWDLMDEIKEPSLVNFDLWDKNIMLIQKEGEYVIDGFIDHERAFYGDPYAEFISSETLCGPVEENYIFQINYSKISGKPFTYTHNDKIRYYMYELYLALLMGVEVYRYNEEDTLDMLRYCNEAIQEFIGVINQLISEK